jgi:hypothetical protein
MNESATVREALHGFYERFSAGDVIRFGDGLAGVPNGMVIGTGPAEWYLGRDAWIAAYQEQITAIPGLRIEAGAAHAWELGAVGWAADRPTFVLPDGTPVPVRLSAVFLRERDTWLPVQAHFSLAVPDEKMGEVLGG